HVCLVGSAKLFPPVDRAHRLHSGRLCFLHCHHLLGLRADWFSLSNWRCPDLLNHSHPSIRSVGRRSHRSLGSPTHHAASRKCARPAVPPAVWHLHHAAAGPLAHLCCWMRPVCPGGLLLARAQRPAASAHSANCPPESQYLVSAERQWGAYCG